NITAGTATKLGFGQQPTTTTVGQAISPAVTVQVLDSFGNIVPTDNGRSITMAIAANHGGGTLGGTTSVVAANSVAMFSCLFFDRVGTNYNLAAASAGLTGVTSSTFTINNQTSTI